MKTVWVAILFSIVFLLPAKGQENANDTMAALGNKRDRLGADSKRNFIAFDGSYLLLSISYGRTIKGTQWGIGGGIGALGAKAYSLGFDRPVMEYVPIRIFATYNSLFFSCETGIRASVIGVPPDPDDDYSEGVSIYYAGVYAAPMVGWKFIKIGPVLSAGISLEYSDPVAFVIPVMVKTTFDF